MRDGARASIAALILVPALIAAFAIAGPFVTDPVLLFGGMTSGARPGALAGSGTIDPNMGFTAFALGVRSVREVLSGSLPLWNHYEGLGAPLLGEMQAASLFPPTLLLLWPHGQMLEQAALQAVAGIGTYLFLRRFGLGVAAAFAGGLLFELNGVFAWLRNAIFNPVAFLPWLLYAVESLFVATAAGRRLAERIPFVVLGVAAGSLALYAGFPEVAYLYGLLVLLWAIARALALTPRDAARFLGELTAIAILTLMVAAPLLLAFASYLGQSELGAHQADLFANVIISPAALPVYLLPYVYGPIFAAPHPVITPVWGDIGGYLGLMPLLLGMGGLLCTWRRPMSQLLTGWIVLSLGATQGAPLLHDAFVALPLVKIVAYCRYLNASWIFCAIVLSAIFIDQIPGSTRRQRIQTGLAAAVATLALLILAIASALPLVADYFQPHGGHRLAAGLSVAVAAALLGVSLLALAQRHPARALTALAAAEALAAFMLPFASFPRGGTLDRKLVEFLQRNVGLQRVVTLSGTALSANFGSAFGIKQLNYDDLPVPARTAAYALARLDPAANAAIFRPTGTSPARLAAYAAAGVRYILADPALFTQPAYAPTGSATARDLQPDRRLTFDLQRDRDAEPIRAVAIRIGTYGGRSDGVLHARLCAETGCADASAPLDGARDNAPLPLRLDPPLAHAGTIRLTLWTQDATLPVALWMRGTQPEVGWIGLSAPEMVLQTETAAVFALDGTRPYAQAPGCTIAPRTEDRIEADCQEPARLVRLEVAMDGWTARVNGAAVPIVRIDDTFQGVDLPAGRSTVEFTYAPDGVRATAWLALITILGLLAALGLAARDRVRSG